MGFVLRWLSMFASATFLKAVLSRVLVALGISALTYTGMTLAASAISAHIASNLSGLSGFALAFLELCKVPQAINLIWSAMMAKLALSGLTSAGKLTRVFWDKDNSIVLNP